MTFASKGSPPGGEGDPLGLSSLEGIDSSGENRPPHPNTQIKFQASAEAFLRTPP